MIRLNEFLPVRPEQKRPHKSGQAVPLTLTAIKNDSFRSHSGSPWGPPEHYPRADLESITGAQEEATVQLLNKEDIFLGAAKVAHFFFGQVDGVKAHR